MCVCPCLYVWAHVLASVCKYVLLSFWVLCLSDKCEALACEIVLEL